MSHQFGSFAGAWLGGYIYDQTGVLRFDVAGFGGVGTFSSSPALANQ